MSYYRDDEEEKVRGFLAWTLTIGLIAVFLMWIAPVHAEMISEFGGGLKLEYSEVFDPGCRQVLIVDANRSTMFDEQGRQKTVPCGGVNPVFIGWPVAWESPNGNTRIGWFHMSHWLSGEPFNHNNELTMNCICATHKFHWRHR